MLEIQTGEEINFVYIIDGIQIIFVGLVEYKLYHTPDFCGNENLVRLMVFYLLRPESAVIFQYFFKHRLLS